jgi:hypothetical protein
MSTKRQTASAKTPARTFTATRDGITKGAWAGRDLFALAERGAALRRLVEMRKGMTADEWESAFGSETFDAEWASFHREISARFGRALMTGDAAAFAEMAEAIHELNATAKPGTGRGATERQFVDLAMQCGVFPGYSASKPTVTPKAFRALLTKAGIRADERTLRRWCVKHRLRLLSQPGRPREGNPGKP